MIIKNRLIMLQNYNLLHLLVIMFCHSPKYFNPIVLFYRKIYSNVKEVNCPYSLLLQKPYLFFNFSAYHGALYRICIFWFVCWKWPGATKINIKICSFYFRTLIICHLCIAGLHVTYRLTIYISNIFWVL